MVRFDDTGNSQIDLDEIINRAFARQRFIGQGVTGVFPLVGRVESQQPVFPESSAERLPVRRPCLSLLSSIIASTCFVSMRFIK